MKKKCFFRVTSIIGVLSLFVSCASFPVPHENSFYNKEESVSITMLDCNDLRDYQTDWEKAFEPVEPESPFPCPKALGDKTVAPVLPILVGVVAPLAFDYVKKELKEESENYVQQFGTTYFGRDFWVAKQGRYVQKYYGIEISRSALRYNDDAANNTEQSHAFRLICGIAEDKEGIYWLAPLYFKTDKTKAKVAKSAGTHSINSKIEIGLDSVWKDDKNKYHKENIARFDPFVVEDYDIDTPLSWHVACDDKTNKTCHGLQSNLNSFAGVPVSSGSKAPTAGNYWITVLVTESDKAKTRKYFVDLSAVLDKNRDKIVDAIKKKVE